MKHTPGPWMFSKEKSALRYAVNDKNNRHIAMVSCYEEKDSDRQENEANAELIAAAPDMLEALETLTAIVGLTAIKYENQKEVLQEAHNIAIAAIKKAKGAK